MGLRYEAWSTPWDPGGFRRKVAILPTIEGSGRGSLGFLSFPGDSSVDISLANFDRLDDLVSDTASSLITVYDCNHDGTQTIIDEWILDRVPSQLGETREVALSGPGLLSVFEKALVYAFDYPNNPTSQGDHIWGGEQKLGNPGFEDGQRQPQEWELEIDATAGTYTLSDGVDTTAPIAFDAQAAQIATAIQNDLGLVDDVTVAGTSVSPYLRTIYAVTPPIGINLTLDDSGLTGEGTLTETVPGKILYSPWTANKYSPIPDPSGNYLRFEVTDEQAHSGTLSLAVQPRPIYPLSGRNPGIEQVLSVTPSQIYTWSMWIRPTNANDTFRIGVYTYGGDEQVALSAIQSPPINTWTQLSVGPFTMPIGITQVRFVVYWANRTNSVYNPSVAYFDDGEVFEGLAATTIGDIWQTLLDDCTIDHAGDDRGTVLEWIDYSSFDAVNDSNGTPWDHPDLSFSARWGSNMTHVLDDTFNRGYEAELVRKATPVGGKTHDFHLYNPGGRDDNPSAAIHTAQPLTGGNALHRNPAYTAALVVGDDGEYFEDTDAPKLTNFGRLETYIKDNEGGSGDLSKLLLSTNLFKFEESNRRAVSFDVVEAPGVPRPFFDYRLGDTIPMTMAPTLAKEHRRVQRIDYVNTQPTRYVVVGSRVLQGEAAAFDLVGRMWRRMNRPPRFIPIGADPVPSSGATHIDVAAADAPGWQKEAARYECDGVNDEVEIQAALDDADFPPGTAVYLSSGTFHIGAYGKIVVTQNQSIIGQGIDTTTLNFETLTSGTGSVIVLSGGAIGGTLRDFSMFTPDGGNNGQHAIRGIGLNVVNIEDIAIAETTGRFNGIGILLDSGGHKIDGCFIQNCAVGIRVNVGGSDSHITNNRLVENGTGVRLDSCEEVLLHDNTIARSGEHGIHVNNAKGNSIADNRITEPSLGAAGTFDGIFVEGDSDNNNIKDNEVVPNPGTQPRHAINISAATCNDNAVIHNDLRPSANFTSGAINDLGTGTLLHGNLEDSGVAGDAAQSNIASFSQSGVLGTGTGSFKFPFTLDAEVVSVQLAVGTSPTGADLIVDVNKNGTTIFTTQANRPTVPAADADGVGAEATPDVTSISEGEYLTVDIDQVGSTVAGEDLTVSIEWRPV